jgi:hypothetical protein
MKKGYMDTLSSKKIIKDQSLLRHEDIRHQIRILPELEALIPPLLPDELAQLEANIRAEGCREALLVWETTTGVVDGATDSAPAYILIDGHNRYGICQRNGLDFRVNLKSFASLEEVRTFMIENQLGRRNLTPEQTAYLRGLRYHAEKTDRGRYDRTTHKGQNVPYENGDLDNVQKTPSEARSSAERTNTAQRLANRFNVNEKTIKRDAAFASGVEKLAPALKADVLAGKVKVNKGQFQALGTSNVPDGSVASLEAVTDLLTADKTVADVPANTTPPGRRTNKPAKPRTQVALQATLKTLTARLTTTADVALCDELIACATDLKALLLR